MDAPSPGWYPDPFDRRCIRWWDGTEWTSYALDVEKRSLSFNPPLNWPVPPDVDILEPSSRPDATWGPAPYGWPLWFDARGEPVPPVPWQGASARRADPAGASQQTVGGRTAHLAHLAFALGLLSLFLALLAFITVVTEDEIGKSTSSEGVALVAFASPRALFRCPPTLEWSPARAPRCPRGGMDRDRRVRRCGLGVAPRAALAGERPSLITACR